MRFVPRWLGGMWTDAVSHASPGVHATPIPVLGSGSNTPPCFGSTRLHEDASGQRSAASGQWQRATLFPTCRERASPPSRQRAPWRALDPHCLHIAQSAATLGTCRNAIVRCGRHARKGLGLVWVRHVCMSVSVLHTATCGSKVHSPIRLGTIP